jgi:hypothetical protein
LRPGEPLVEAALDGPLVERVNWEIGWRADVVAAANPAWALLIEHNDEWLVGRR